MHAFLGMVNYYAHFIQNLSGKMKPLYNLVGKNQTFKWDKNCQAAFEFAKGEN